jgi:hypothetical protein
MIAHTFPLIIKILVVAWALTFVGLAVLGVRYHREQRRAIVRRISWYTAGADTDV